MVKFFRQKFKKEKANKTKILPQKRKKAERAPTFNSHEVSELCPGTTVGGSYLTAAASTNLANAAFYNLYEMTFPCFCPLPNSFIIFLKKQIPKQTHGAHRQPRPTSIPRTAVSEREKSGETERLRDRKTHSPLAATQRFPEPLLTKNELGTNSSSESESAAGWAAPLPSNRPGPSLAGGEGGGEGDCSGGVEEADEQRRGGPAGHRHTHTERRGETGGGGRTHKKEK